MLMPWKYFCNPVEIKNVCEKGYGICLQYGKYLLKYFNKMCQLLTKSLNHHKCTTCLKIIKPK